MNEKVLSIGVDPDTKHTGFAVVQAFNGGFQIVEVGLIRAKGRLAADRRAPMAQSLRSTLSSLELPYAPTILALEWQHIRPRKEKRPNDIVNLNGVAGMTLQAFMERWHFEHVFTPIPFDWKKTVEKGAKQRQILRRLHLTSELTYETGTVGAAIPGSENVPMSMRSHVIDALGLAIWSLDPYGPLMDIRVSEAATARTQRSLQAD